jgi:hypothetical protein
MPEWESFCLINHYRKLLGSKHAPALLQWQFLVISNNPKPNQNTNLLTGVSDTVLVILTVIITSIELH